MIDDLTIQKIKDAASIVDVIGDFYDLRKAGAEYMCRCPFHDDRHIGSFKISPRKNYAKCFSCGWQGGPIDFLMEHERLSFVDALRWLGKKYSIEVEGADNFHAKPSLPRPQVPPLPMLTLPMWMVEHTGRQREENTLVKWLRTGIKWDAAQRRNLDEALRAYHIGHAKTGHTMFWQIDERGIVRTGKMMLYKPDGHRDKDARHGFDWMHAALYRDQRNNYSADLTDAKPCLFGLHLLDRYKTVQRQQVCIVESEKTALIMAAAYGNHPGQVWMACGGIENLNRDKLKPIIEQQRDIVLYPDRDGISRWQAKAEALRYDRLTIDTKPVTQWWQEADGPKADIADVVVRIINNAKIYKTVEEVIKDIPIVRKLNEKLHLSIVKP